jgi:serine/threonine protein phosphatase PrpC
VGNMQGFNMFGVLDGHGPQGHFVSKFCKEYFIRTFDDFAKQCVSQGISTPEAIYNKLKSSNYAFIKESYKNADLQMAKLKQFEYNFSGTTCNLVFQFNNHLLDFNVGDSRSILVEDSGDLITQIVHPL